MLEYRICYLANVLNVNENLIKNFKDKKNVDKVESRADEVDAKTFTFGFMLQTYRLTIK